MHRFRGTFGVLDSLSSVYMKANDLNFRVLFLMLNPISEASGCGADTLNKVLYSLW